MTKLQITYLPAGRANYRQFPISNFRILALFIVCLLFVVYCSLPSQANPSPQWSAFGQLINNTAGNTPQKKPIIIPSNNDSQIIVWEDSRNGFVNLYAQKTNSFGEKLWPKEDVCLAPVDSNQIFARAISDQSGGLIVVWQDYRNNNTDIYAQRIDQKGNLLWGQRGQVVCNQTVGQYAPELTGDGLGGAIITWHDYRGGQGEDIYAQRLDNQGLALWPPNGLPVCQSKGTQWYPQIVGDKSGGAVIVWSDGRKGSNNYDIYAQRIKNDGQMAWAKDGVAICQAKKNQSKPRLALSQNSLIIVWEDDRESSSDIYSQKVSLLGKINWQQDGLAICTAAYDQENLTIKPDSQGGAIIAWQDKRENLQQIYSQKVSASGQLSWRNNGQPVNELGGNQKQALILTADQNNWFFLWLDDRSGHWQLFAQKLTSAGLNIFNPQGVALAPTESDQTNFSATNNSNHQAIIVWQDQRQGQGDIYSQKISSQGQRLLAEQGNIVCQAKGSVNKKNIDAVLTADGNAVIAFEDERSGFFNIFLQKVDAQGSLLWNEDGIAAAPTQNKQSNPKVLADKRGGIFAAWEDSRNNKIRLQHFNSRGEKSWPSSLVVAQSQTSQTKPLLLLDSEDNALIVWQENRDVLSLQDLFAQKVSPQGKKLWGNQGKIVVSANGNQIDASLVSDGKNGFFIAWTDYRKGERNSDIFCQHINSQGEPLWQTQGLKICGAPDMQRAPQITADQQGGFYVSWTDKGGGSYDIYGQRVSAQGQTLWLKDGVPINQLSRTQQNSLFANNVIVWEDYRFGNWDIFATAINSQGLSLWGETAQPVVNLPQTQYAPKALAWQGETIVGWEDYRSGKHYEIYLQKLDSNGKSKWQNNGIKVKTKNGARFIRLVGNPNYGQLYLFWEDFTSGNRAIYGQKFVL